MSPGAEASALPEASPNSLSAAAHAWAAQGSARPRTWVALQLWCLSCVPVCLSSSACAGDQPFHKPGVPAASPVPRAPEVPSLTARDPTSGPERWVQQARPASGAALSLPPPGKGPAASAGQRPAGRERHIPAAGGTEKQAVRRPGKRGAWPLLHLHPALLQPVGEWVPRGPAEAFLAPPRDWAG